MFFAGMWFDSALEHHQPTLGKQPDISINTARSKPILTRNLKPDVRFTPPQSKIDQKETSAVFGIVWSQTYKLIWTRDNRYVRQSHLSSTQQVATRD